MLTSPMGDSTRRAKKRWGLASAILGFTIVSLGAAAVASGPREPKLSYAAYTPDERLTAAGALVRPEIEALQEKMVAREIARITAAQKYAPAPAIWKIADADTTIYMFGTIHSLPPGFRWRNPGLEAVIVRADTLLLESVEAEDDGVTFLEGVSAANLAALPPLRDRVSPMLQGRLAEVQKMLPAETVKTMDAMPTWIAALGIGFVRDLAAGDIPGQGADDWLEQHFRAVGKPVEAIEDSKAVIGNINAIPEEAQRMMLEAALASPPRNRIAMDTPAHAWAQGQVDDDSPLRIRPEDLDPSAALADPLLDRRNIAWVADLLERMRKPGVTLFAAGAGHFVGPGSVIDLLQKRGVRVERVQ